MKYWGWTWFDRLRGIHFGAINTKLNQFCVNSCCIDNGNPKIICTDIIRRLRAFKQWIIFKGCVKIMSGTKQNTSKVVLSISKRPSGGISVSGLVYPYLSPLFLDCKFNFTASGSWSITQSNCLGQFWKKVQFASGMITNWVTPSDILRDWRKIENTQ